MPEPLGIDNVFIPVANLEQAVRWYADVAGMSAKVRTDDMAVLDVGGDVAGIVLTVSPEPMPVRIWLEVSDAAAVAAELGTSTFAIPTGLTTEIADPWGNKLGFADYTARPQLARTSIR